MFYMEQEGMLTELRFSEEDMNWIREDSLWGQVTAPACLHVKVRRWITPNHFLHEEYVLTNTGDVDFFSCKGDIAICTPLPDNYPSTDICLKSRCHIHLYTSGESSWLKAHRMCGSGTSLGMLLTAGSLCGYEIHRDPKVRSNDRGILSLWVSPLHLCPGEKAQIAWDIFPFEGNAQFDEIASAYPNMKIRHPKRMVWFEGENLADDMTGSIVLPAFEDLLSARVHFIAEKQQYHRAGSRLDGAFLIYDNEEQHLYYAKTYDHNAGRERVGMGVLLATYLQHHADSFLEDALEQYTAFVHRELFDAETGVVYNDIGRDNTWNRLYNYPWMAVFFMERYKLNRDPKELLYMYRALSSYYAQGGERFYALGIPMCESLELLDSAGMKNEYTQLKALYCRHGDVIAENGIHYPASEVNFEQSIVAPAVIILFELYRITGENKYLLAAEEQIKVLDAFSGDQPDYHLFEVAVRHWDGYWFGKHRYFGDTFPHYWSALTGIAYWYAALCGKTRYQEKAENALRAVLTMFSRDGSATCAYVYPDRVNDKPAKFADPWANDQDWGMYFYLKTHS